MLAKLCCSKIIHDWEGYQVAPQSARADEICNALAAVSTRAHAEVQGSSTAKAQGRVATCGLPPKNHAK